MLLVTQRLANGEFTLYRMYRTRNYPITPASAVQRSLILRGCTLPRNYVRFFCAANKSIRGPRPITLEGCGAVPFGFRGTLQAADIEKPSRRRDAALCPATLRKQLRLIVRRINVWTGLTRTTPRFVGICRPV